MISAQFDYAAPDSLEAAVKLLTDHEGAQVLVGSPSLITNIKLGHAAPSLLVDLCKIADLQGIQSQSGSGLQMGAMTTYAQAAAHADVKAQYPALAEALDNLGDPQIRNQGRIGDVFAYRDLACDLPAVALALEATFHTVSSQGTRTVSADEVVVTAQKAKLQPGEIITALSFPASGAGSAYEKFKHPASSHTICGIAASIERSPDGTVQKCRVAFTGVGVLAIRLHQVEAALEGQALTAETIAAAAKQATESLPASEETQIPDIIDRYASAEYRTYLKGVLAEKALTRAAERLNAHS